MCSVWLAVGMLLLLAGLAATGTKPVLLSVDPESGGRSGGTVVTVRGEQFLEGATCVFEDPSVGSTVSQLTTLYNSSCLECSMPALEYLNFISADGHFVDLSVTNGSDSRSNSVQFLVYDVEAMTITTISPSEGLHYVSNAVTIHGQGFLDTGETACHVSLYDTHFIRPAEFVNQTELQCTLPALPSPTLQSISVSLNQQEATFIPSTNMLFTFTADPPSITSAMFNSAYTTLYLAFDREVELGGIAAPLVPTPLTCAAVLSMETLVLLGAGVECYWRNSQQREIIISLPQSSTAAQNSVLTVLDGAIRTRHASYSRLISGTINITLPSPPLTPIAVLEGPQTVPPCGYLTLRGHNSQGGGYTPLLYHWDIDAVQGDKVSQALDFPAGYSSLSSITIQSELLQEDTEYSVRLTVRNFLGAESSASHRLTPSQSHSIPTLIMGGSLQEVCVHTTLVVEAAPIDILSECSNYTMSSEYNWRVLNQDGNEEALEVRTNTSVLTLPPFSLFHDQIYTVIVNTEHEDINATVMVTTSEPCLVAHIAGGDYRELDQSETVVLEGSSSEGLSTDVASDPLFHLQWTCSFDGVPCLNKEGLEVELPADVTISIPPNTLPTGTYTFTLSLYYNNHTSVAESSVQIVRDSPPLLQISLPRCCGPIPVHTNVTVLATVYSEVFSFVRWTVESVPAYAEFELTPLVTSSPLTLPILTPTETTPTECSDVLLVNVTNQIALNIVGGELLHDNMYRISLEAINEEEKALAKAYIDLHTALPPSQGTVSVQNLNRNVTPRSVTTITADGWTDTPDDTPLMYRFGLASRQCPGIEVAPVHCETVSWISGYSLVSSLETIPLSYSTNHTVVVEVTDTRGAVAIESVDVVGSDSTGAVTVLESVVREVTERGRWREGIAGLAVLLGAVEHSESLFSDDRVVVVETLLHINKNHLPSSPSYLTLFLSLLHQATHTPHLLTLSSAQRAAWVVRDAVAILASPAKRWDRENVALGLTEKINTASTALDTLLSLVLEYSSEMEQRRVQDSTLTSNLLSSLPFIGCRVCQQLSIGESELLSIGDEGGTLKIARSLLLANYSASTLCDGEGCENDDVIINFGSKLFWDYFHWKCDEKLTNQISGSGIDHDPAFCFGVCVLSALLNFDLRWQGNQYTHHVVSPVLTLSLLHPRTGHTLTPPSSPDTFTLNFTRIPPSLNKGELLCALWDGDTLEWNTNKCTTLMVGGDGVVCECEFRGHVETALVERCPSGHYGLNCTEECPQGLWGEECAELCNCSVRGTCLSHDGSCDCDPGWMGQSCQEECEAGRWGKGCAELCLCRNAVSCDHITGSCDCMHGWIGKLCDSPCPRGTYGYYCIDKCQCRLDSECQKEDGVCVCEVGYTGDLCLDPCPEGVFGTGCGSRCECSAPGTLSCHHVTGNCSCYANYTGPICNELIPMPVVQAGLPAVILALPVVVVLITAVAITAVVIAILLWRKSKRKQVLPISEARDEGEGGVKGASGEGVREATEGEGSQLNMTHAESLEVLVPKGKKLQELFPQKTSDNEDIFQEPPKAHTKLRWQVIQVVSEETRLVTPEGTHRGESDLESELFPSKVSFSLQTESQELVIKNCTDKETSVMGDVDGEDGDEVGEGGSEEEEQGDSEGGSVDQTVMVCYRRGVYLDPDATLKDLRNAFLDSGQLEGENRFLQFLKSDVPGDTIAIETEDETYLTNMERDLVEPRTIHFQLMDEDGHTELCVCGRYADMECSECHAQGYCSTACQTQHWLQHAHSCRVVSARTRQRKRRKRRKSHEIMSAAVTPGTDLCPCGKEAEFDCSQCHLQGYCSEKCQLKDWPRHQKLCPMRSYIT